jgi:hypothetical protein
MRISVVRAADLDPEHCLKVKTIGFKNYEEKFFQQDRTSG